MIKVNTYLTSYSRWGVAVVLLILVTACSTAKYIPEGENLLSNVAIKVDNSNVDREELKLYLRQRENTRILGFLKFHLWLYNLSSPKKTDNWLKNAGEKPQIYSPALAELSKEQIGQYLRNKGYYNALINYETEVASQKQKINLQFNIKTGDAFHINQVSYAIKDTVLASLFNSGYSSRLLKTGNRFDLDMLDKERDNIVTYFKNRGYYYFSKSMIVFEADTTRQKSEVDLKLVIALPAESVRDSVKIFKPYRLNHFTFSVLAPSQTSDVSLPAFSDTLLQGRNTVIFNDKNIQYNPRLFYRLNKLADSDYYHSGNAERTFNGFNRLRQFRFVNIYFREIENQNDTSSLNCFIDLVPLSKQSTSIDVEGTNTSGNFGVAGNLTYSHRNLFKGAEILQMKLKGAMERQQAILRDESRQFNTREVGIESTLIVPKLIGPGSFFRSSGDFLPKTLFTLGYNYQQRPDYTRRISTMRVGYEWMATEFKRHNWNVIDFNMVNLSRFNPEFINSLYDLYIKSSFTDHLILATNYSFAYNTQVLKTRSNYSYIRLSAESSGNLLYLLSNAFQAKQIIETDTTGLIPQKYYTIFNSRYAQYVKGDFEYRRGYMLDDFNSVVGRFFMGIGVPYGNFDVLPFEKKYFTGGANGIRAWQVRSLGPGTYRAPVGSYPNQSGDIKIEANIEYRFHLISFLEGVFFLDAGNVWAINEKDNRLGAQFKPGTFYKQIALGTGTGIRFDFEYFIFRLDLGLKMRDPAQNENKGWIIGARKLVNNDLNFSFAIGYPF